MIEPSNPRWASEITSANQTRQWTIPYKWGLMGKSSISIYNISIHGGCSIATFDCQRVTIWRWCSISQRSQRRAVPQRQLRTWWHGVMSHAKTDAAFWSQRMPPSHFMVVLHLRFTTQQPFIVILFIAPTVIWWCYLHVFWRLGQAQNSRCSGVFQVQKHAKTNGFWCSFRMFEQKPINLHHWRSRPACFCSCLHSVCHPFVRVGW